MGNSAQMYSAVALQYNSCSTTAVKPVPDTAYFMDPARTSEFRCGTGPTIHPRPDASATQTRAQSQTRRARDADSSQDTRKGATHSGTGHPKGATHAGRGSRERKSAGVRGGEGSRDRARWRDPRPGRADGSCTVQLYAHRSAVHHSSNHISAGGAPPNATWAMIAHWTPP